MKSRKIKRSKKQKKLILDGGGDDIKIIVRDFEGNRYELLVNPEHIIQTILDKYKCELIKNSKWPINENEYKYILQITGREILSLSEIISDVGIATESTININITEIINKEVQELQAKVEKLEEKVEKLEEKVLELEGFNWIEFFGFPLQYYNGYYVNQKKVSAETIISAFKIIKKSKGNLQNRTKLSHILFQIMRHMNDENLGKLIPFLIDNNI
jgi:hypothetical protein